MKKYTPQKIEKKWQRFWEKQKLHETADRPAFAKAPAGKNFMMLAEFPYTSGNLHMGHWFTYSVADMYARYLRMNGYNVMFPIGFDAFGLPAENAAIKHGSTPQKWTTQNIKNMTKQLKTIGAAFDWSRVVDTSDPDYYKWTQWIFLKLYEKGLAYRGSTTVNWCPKDKTVLANEQVVEGKCDRCDTPVEQRELTQWMFKITAFADSLIDDLEGLDWPETTKIAQKNWIGRSEGTIAEFPIINSQLSISDQLPKLETGNWKLETAVEVFTTRADTMFGATYVVLAPEHPLVEKLKKQITNNKEAEEYIDQTKRKSELQRMTEVKDKTGVELKGISAINPINKKPISVWIADYVLAHYGTGAVMAVPAHDQRDYDFAKKFNLPIKQVVLNDEEFIGQANQEEGVLINSDRFDGMPSEEARKKITEQLKAEGLGRAEKTYRLHDWILSRQRYWGAPIPMINCPACALRDPSGQGYQPVPEEDLPVKLPKLDDFLPVEGGKSPLARAEKWLKVKCPKCGSKDADRDTDTMDTFVDSSWYFVRYTDPHNDDKLADKEKISKWLPVPMYIGGREHNTMHLLYARFITKALNSLGHVEFSEPFISRRNHGVIMGPDGKRMSKSRGNVVDPDGEVAAYGADIVRMNFAFLGPFDQDYAWNPDGLAGIQRFLNRVWNFVSRYSDNQLSIIDNQLIHRVLNRAIKEVGDQIKHHKFNTGVSSLMKLLNELDGQTLQGETLKKISKSQYEVLLKLLAPFAPHIAEELWIETLSHETSIHLESWPEYDEALLQDEMVTVVVQVNGKVRDSIIVKRGLIEAEVKELVLANEKIKKHLEGREIKKLIHIPDKLVNIVVP